MAAEAVLRTRSTVMNPLGSLLAATQSSPGGRQNVRPVVVCIAILIGVMALYTVLFHVLMAMEGQSHSWSSGLYWTLVTMSTLGFSGIGHHQPLDARAERLDDEPGRRADRPLARQNESVGSIRLSLDRGRPGPPAHGHGPGPQRSARTHASMLIVGSLDSEKRFLERYSNA